MFAFYAEEYFDLLKNGVAFWVQIAKLKLPMQEFNVMILLLLVVYFDKHLGAGPLSAGQNQCETQ